MKATLYGWLSLAVLSFFLIGGDGVLAEDSGSQNQESSAAPSFEVKKSGGTVSGMGTYDNTNQIQPQTQPQSQPQSSPETDKYEVHISGTTVSGIPPADASNKDQ